MTTSWRILPVLLAVLVVLSALALEEDFAFDISDDLEVEFPPDAAKKVWGMADITATVGRIFHLVVPKDSFGDSVKHYEAKVDQDKPLPSWLLFDKTGGIFWGVPLEEDIGVLHVSVKAVRPSNTVTDEFTLLVKKETADPEGIDKCPSNEDSTVLTLIIDKSVNAIKPKQRIIAINNVAKFFAITHGAFILKSEEPVDVTDSSVVLAGPGDLKTRSSKATSIIQVTVGCEGRLWLNSAPMIHQLKQQARDGTISEVLRLPLVGWRVKTDTRPLLRQKRQDDGYGGSGDYEYYYDEYDDPDKEPDEPSSPEPLPTTPSTTRAVVHSSTHLEPLGVATTPESHPHRHHHGEAKPAVGEPRLKVTEDSESEFPEPTAGSNAEDTEIYFSPDDADTSPAQSSTAVYTTSSTAKSPGTATSTTPTTIAATTAEEEPDGDDDEEGLEVTPITGLYKPSETLDSDDEYDEEEYEDGDENESITEIPFTRNEIFTHNARLPILPEIVTDTEATSTVVSTPRTKPAEVLPETVVPTLEERNLTEEATSSTSTSPSTTTTVTTTTTTTVPPTTTAPTTPAPKVTTVEEEAPTTKHTTLRHTVSSTQTVTAPQPTETIEYEMKNFAPTVQIRLNRIVVTAGKHFSQIVPEDMFSDMEDGNKLKLEFLDKDGNPANQSSWCQFNPIRREIYGIPLEEDVSHWEFFLRATDREGASVTELVEIRVQQNKYWRVVNHEFSLFARVEKKQDFIYPIDWALHILKGIGIVFHAANTSKITVRSVSYHTDPIIFTWTNDSLATNYCPKSEIDQLFGLLTANDEGDPSITLSRSLSPEIRAKKVTQRRMGVCEEAEVPLPPPPLIPATPPSPILPPVPPPSNLAPILRNPVDHLKATVGELFLFRVPDDTFYDPEDVDPRNLKVQLYTVDRQPISAEHWLQFDSKNKEFYGIPTQRDARRSEYQLVCEDTGGLIASDTLVVEILPAQRASYNVEFSMTIETEYGVFATSASLKRKFVEKLQELFSDNHREHIQLSTITRGSGLIKESTIITWYNKSLAEEECPWDDIKQLEQLLVTPDRIISNYVHKIMGEEFSVAAFRLQNLGVCKTVPITTRTQDAVVPVDETSSQESHDEYLITFIVPAVIISTMLLLAGIAACVLYRRRRSGKMNIEEDGRQSYGNKGIPVIFQEELDEKPEPGTKAPVILKDEKPPLAPPEYSKSGSLKLQDDSEPYQPPPPFTRTQDNGRQPRPKPTPTYRKPPPYVPP